MVNLWTLGQLSWRELLIRTWRETWEDAVFGQAARLAFYHFLAMFPGLLLLFFLLGKFPGAAPELRSTLARSLSGILPRESAALMQTMIEKLNQTATAGMGIFSAGLGAAWAAVNGTWALLTGLDTAYEVKEQRRPWKVVGIAALLTASVTVLFILSLCVVTYGTRAAEALGQRFGGHASLDLLTPCIQWPVLVVLLLACFALFYRFGPNLSDREWQWSTPGAVLALLLWLLATGLVRLYFERVHSYHVVYGPLEGVAMLLLWLYFTSAAILIGGEMNSEIEKAAGRKTQSNGASRHAREGR